MQSYNYEFRPDDKSHAALSKALKPMFKPGLDWKRHIKQKSSPENRGGFLETGFNAPTVVWRMDDRLGRNYLETSLGGHGVGAGNNNFEAISATSVEGYHNLKTLRSSRGKIHIIFRGRQFHSI